MRLQSRLLGSVCALGIVAAVVAAQDAPQVYVLGEGITPPRLVKAVKPTYTQEARDAKIVGVVIVSAVVLDDGSVGEVKVTRSLDTVYGLDEEAVKATKQCEFKPGTKDGKPVAVRVDIEMSFRLT